ncbi:Carboxyl/Cholinesterase 24 [Frankliniella occidentalis]|uniref:Carboxylic ester hydrolase n=1 Tax=Frankliniella occidentalis TaxID=133901 RepID=A0A6J1RY66_FRAOC|nr:esterase E4-like [Frankliniella occidentalis]KAE8748921.1 Carboxyl/Cholinesterase 24 [Frankliniella occidentalis]
MSPTRRRKLVWIIAGVVVIVAIAVAVATYFALRDPGDEAPTPDSAVPEVSVIEGRLRGEWVEFPEYNIRYAAFRGIPYARPPTGELRFKAPLPAAGWSGVRNATTEGSACLQQDIYTQKLTGSEDCLYLNVYSPRAEGSTELLAVYFFIHGGSFLFGSGSSLTFGPEFFMLNDMVVVTINYRLNAFGFLNLDNDVVPGNVGIKDQIAALQWVHRNIDAFGGNPDLITIGGQSAGAVSAHWLSLLPEPKDLAHRVILESGSALHSWGYNEDNFDVALDLGSRLTNGSTVSLQDVARLVMELPAMDILAAAVALANDSMNSNATQIPFATSPERRSPHDGYEAPLITQDPEKYILADKNPLPIFMGMNSREWLFSFYYYGYAARPDYMRFRIAHLDTVFPKNVKPSTDTAAYLKLTNKYTLERAVAKTYQYFFRYNNSACDDTCVFKLYLDDIVIGTDMNRLAELRARSHRSQTYVYRFAVRANYSTSNLVDPAQATGGAVHSDELGYLWKMSVLQQRLEGDGLASDTLRRMVKIWSSYIRSGIPDPGPDHEGKWTPNEFRTLPGNVIFLNIAETLDVREEPIMGQNADFWLFTYSQYRDDKSA